LSRTQRPRSHPRSGPADGHRHRHVAMASATGDLDETRGEGGVELHKSTLLQIESASTCHARSKLGRREQHALPQPQRSFGSRPFGCGDCAAVASPRRKELASGRKPAGRRRHTSLCLALLSKEDRRCTGGRACPGVRRHDVEWQSGMERRAPLAVLGTCTRWQRKDSNCRPRRQMAVFDAVCLVDADGRRLPLLFQACGATDLPAGQEGTADSGRNLSFKGLCGAWGS
jgi:hypothetical protein